MVWAREGAERCLSVAVALPDLASLSIGWELPRYMEPRNMSLDSDSIVATCLPPFPPRPSGSPTKTQKMLRNAKTEYFNEHEEIATYLGMDGEVPRGADQVIDRRLRHRGGAEGATPAPR